MSDWLEVRPSPTMRNRHPRGAAGFTRVATVSRRLITGRYACSWCVDVWEGVSIHGVGGMYVLRFRYREFSLRACVHGIVDLGELIVLDQGSDHTGEYYPLATPATYPPVLASPHHPPMHPLRHALIMHPCTH